jgi:cell wall-associated NlpC family hydrolase
VVSGQSLDAYFRRKGSPLAGSGNAFVRAGQRYGFDPRLLVAISGAESSFGRFAQGHNPFGWGPGIHFANWGQAIDTVARGLKQNYLNQGLRTVEQIQGKWAPAHVANDPTGLNQNWTRNVRSFLRELGGGGGPLSASPTQTRTTTTSPPTVSGPDIAGMISGQLGAGYPIKPTQQLQNMVDLIRSTPEQTPQHATQQTGVTFEAGSSSLERKAVGLVMASRGTPYVWGGSRPGGFDCSGLLQWAWGRLGVRIPRTTYDQWRVGRAVGRNQLRPGDAVFFRGSDPRGGLPGHVGMYIGGGKFIEAPHSGATVRISTLAGRSDYQGARRYA